MTAAERFSPGASLSDRWFVLNLSDQNTDINNRVNHEGLIYIHWSVGVLKGKIKPQILQVCFSVDEGKEERKQS